MVASLGDQEFTQSSQRVEDAERAEVDLERSPIVDNSSSLMSGVLKLINGTDGNGSGAASQADQDS